MKFVIIIYVLLFVPFGCESSCTLDNETIQLFWAENQYYEFIFSGYYENRFLEIFSHYISIRTELKNVVDLQYPKLQCDIEEICTTTIPTTKENNNETLYNSFCDLYLDFEHKKEYLFTIDHLDLWVFSRRNVSLHSEQLINKSENLSFNTR